MIHSGGEKKMNKEEKLKELIKEQRKRQIASKKRFYAEHGRTMADIIIGNPVKKEIM